MTMRRTDFQKSDLLLIILIGEKHFLRKMLQFLDGSYQFQVYLRDIYKNRSFITGFS